MKHIKKVSLILLIVGLTFNVMASEIEEMHCPVPESVKFVKDSYQAPVSQKGWEGRWISRPHKQGEVAQFSSAQYISDNNSKTQGTLTNCTYKLKRGEGDVDLEYHKNSEGGGLKTLTVSIENQPNWRKESGATGIQGYECTKSATECKFTPLKGNADD